MKTNPSLAETTCPTPMVGHLRSPCVTRLLPLLILLALPAVAQAQDFTSPTNNGTINNAVVYDGNPVVPNAAAADLPGNLFNGDSLLTGVVSNSPSQFRLPFANDSAEPQLRAQFNEWSVSQFQGEAGDKPAVMYGPGLELRAVKPINVVQSKKYPGIEYSGILVQAANSNPLQLINPFAPSRYGNGEPNIVRNLVTRAAEGLKLWQISF